MKRDMKHDMKRDQYRRGELATVAGLYLAVGGARLWLGMLLAALVVAAGMALLATSGWFIATTGIAGMAGAALSVNVFVPSAAIRLLALLRTFGRYGERIVTHDATLAVSAALREQLLRAWASPAAARALLRRPARVLFRITNDVDALESVYLRLLAPAAAALGAAVLAAMLAAMLAATLATMLANSLPGMLDVCLGVATFAWLLACGWGIAWVTARRAIKPALRRARAIERLREASIDLVAGQTDLMMAGRLPAAVDAIAAADRRLARIDDQLHRLDTRAGWTYGVAGHAGVAAVLLCCGALAEEGRLAAPMAALALLTALAGLEPFAALRRGAMEAGRSSLAARRVAPRLRDGVVATTKAQPAVTPVPPGTAVELIDAVVTHEGRARPALSSIKLRIGAGERVAVIGASGAGKSTLLGLIAGEWPATSGAIAAQPACWMSQRVDLFQDSLRDNLRLAAPDADDARLWAALREAGLEAQVRALAQGLDSRLGEGGLGLSGGQARRLALARLLLRDAGLWLLDEPTEALDAATAADVLLRLQERAAGRTVLIACHARREAQLADRILVLEGGVLAADVARGSAAFEAALARLRPD